jgi:hypothetical protein
MTGRGRGEGLCGKKQEKKRNIRERIGNNQSIFRGLLFDSALMKTKGAESTI